MPMQIVERIDGKSNSAYTEQDMELLEPAFLADNILPRFAKSTSAKKIIDFMAQQIVRKPGNLQLHLNRIYFYQQQSDANGVYGALLDLFIVLQEKGQPLRQRLLKKYYAELTAEQQSILSNWLAGKRDENAPCPAVKESRLSDGRTGTSGVLAAKEKPSGQAQTRDVVEDARDLIDSGQVGEATVLLKKALLVNPQREEISRELMLIYRHSHNLQAVEKILQSTKNLPLALQPQWRELSAELQKEVGKDNRQYRC